MKALPHLIENPEIDLKNYLHIDENDPEIRKIAFE